MNARTLHAEFADAGRRAGGIPLYDDRTALRLIARARQANLAISGIEMVRPAEVDQVDPPPGRILRDRERASSWAQARSFVEMLAGRDLYFLVVIESPWSTGLARARSLARMLVRDNTSHRLPP